MVVADLVWWWTGGHRSDNGPVDEREKEKGKRKEQWCFYEITFFLNMEMTILTKIVV
jgi:hypothetical protein